MLARIVSASDLLYSTAISVGIVVQTSSDNGQDAARLSRMVSSSRSSMS
jgi:hypothetical protein